MPELALRVGLDFGLELEVLEVGLLDVSRVEEMTAGPFGDEIAVDQLPGIGVLARLPPIHRLAVEERNPARFLILGPERISGASGQ